MSCVCLAATLLLALASGAVAREPVRFHTGPPFREALKRPLSASWDNMDLRTIVERIQSQKRIAILIDRRIDPSRIRFADAAEEPLHTFIERLAAESNAGVSLLGNVVYLGPAGSSSKLRTLAEVRLRELSDKELHVPKGRTIELTRGRTIRWEDLDRPADILRRIAEEAGLSLAGLEQVPHDLWAAATLPDTSPIEALSLVLVQFDLTFAWIDEGRGARLEPVPEVVAIDRTYPAPRGVSPAAALQRWNEAIPDLEGRVEKGQVIIRGPVEVHELIDRIRKGERISPQAPRDEGPQLKALEKQRYSLKIQQTPASALLKKLGEPAHGKLTFQYDAAELKAAGIDLDKRVTFEVEKVPIRTLLEQTFDPLGVEFEIDMQARVVTLRPARR